MRTSNNEKLITHHDKMSYSAVCSTGACLLLVFLADRVGLSCLTLERMLLTLVVLVGRLRFSARSVVLLDMFGMVCHSALVHFLQRFQCQLNVCNKRVTSCPRKIFTHNNSHELKLLAVGSHGVGRYYPAPLSQMVSNRKFVEVVFVLGVQSERYKRQTFTPFLTHDQETEMLEGRSKVVRCTGKIKHDGAITVLTETNHLVILANNLGGPFGEVEGERGLVGAKVVDVEHQLLRKVLGRAPDDPADAWVHLEDR